MRFPSFISFITFALAVSAYSDRLSSKRAHHELAVVVGRRAGSQCRPRISSKPTDSATISDRKPASAPETPRMQTSIVAHPPSSSTSTSTATTFRNTRVVEPTLPSALAAPPSAEQGPPQAEAISVARVASSFIPNGIKAGIAGGDAYSFVKDHIGWWYDWSPTPNKSGRPIGVPMLWGGGTADSQDAARYAAFKKIATPQYVLGFEEPDCKPGSGSAGLTVDRAVQIWEQMIAPLKAKGAKLGSPSMCSTYSVIRCLGLLLTGLHRTGR